jgi:hypothetical protein
VDLRNCSYSFIYNDYLGFSVGMTGSYSQRVNQDTTISVTVPGRISFGNLKGSLRPEAADDNTGLTGGSAGQFGFPRCGRLPAAGSRPRLARTLPATSPCSLTGRSRSWAPTGFKARASRTTN